MTAPTITPSERAAFYAFLAAFHGHRCPMSVMGARLGLAARARVGRHGVDGDVSATYHHRTCAIDGIQAALGTTAGNQNLEVLELGEHYLVAVNRTSGKRAALRLTDEALALGRRYAELRRTGGSLEAKEALLVELEELDESRVVREVDVP